MQGFLPVKSEDNSQPMPPITLSFAARDYGRIPMGRLVVATADTQWIYALGVKMTSQQLSKKATR